MKKLLFALLLTWSFNAGAQVYNNEWIDYSKTYYKFKVGKTGIYRIPQSLLSSVGLGSTPAEEFQLWRNGVQVPLFTSIPSGALSGSDYIEFWGQKNDGKPDLELYRQASYQLNNYWSLQTDTAAYFLTVNSAISNNLRFTSAINNVSGNTLPADTWFMYTAGKYFNDRLNHGYALSVGEFLYSSSYDKGEGWTSTELFSNAYGNGSVLYGTNSFVFKNLNAYNGGPAPKFKIKVSGNTVNYRTYKTVINSDSVISKRFAFFETSTDSTNFSISTLNSVSDTVTVINQSEIACYPAPVGCQSDRMVIHQYEITYPRIFNFAGAKQFEFTLPANASGNFLQISNFSYGGTLPVLYDLTNGKRYIGDTSASPMVQFVLEPSMVSRNLVLENMATTEINTVAELQTRNFIDYTSVANQGDYLIITSPAFFVGAGGSNPINDYRVYRAGAAGGSYNAKVYLIDEIIDQFGFGIKKNPAGLRNFIRYARMNYAVSPKHVFIIGRGVNYVDYNTIDKLILPPPGDPEYANILDQKNTLAKLNFVPPFGYPASDILFTSEPGSSLPLLSIGRLSAITSAEVSTYLKKVKEYETAQVTMSNRISDRAWMKNIVHIIGASEPGLDATLTADMRSYEAIIKDTLFGGHVETFSKSSSDYIEQLNSTRLQNMFSDGISIITYFGHSNSNNLEFSLDNPENYNNFKKYPIFIGLGCNAGNFFKYSTARLFSKETLSEKYVLSPDRGTIAFVASTHFGIVHYLDIWATRAYKEISYRSYGKTLGEIMKNTAKEVFNFTTQEDFYARCNTEESELHGDPAIRVNPHPKPDYVVEDPMVRVTPGFVSIADPNFRISAKFLNMGMSPDSNIVVQITRQFPNNPTPVVILRDTIKGIRYMDSVNVVIPIDPNNDKGLNKITVSIDADGNVDEMFENNNSVTKDVFIYEDEARPVSPYNYSIVSKQNIKLVASTANAFATSKQYKMEIDTTERFNSPQLTTRTINTSGGVLEFDPGVVFMDSTVYYWRVAPVVTTGPTIWNQASFVYLANSESGFNQSGFFQHLKSETDGITLDSSSRKWKFGFKFENLFLRVGSWVTSTGQEVGLSVSVNSNAFIRNTCAFQSVVFNVFDPVTFQPMVNTTLVPSASPFVGWGLYGSAANSCNYGRQNNFEFRWDSVSNRKRAMDFMKNNIPDGAYVIVRSFLLDPIVFPQHAAKLKYANDWMADEAVNGTGQTLYHMLKNAGFAGIDSFNRPRQFALIYKKNDPSFIPKWIFSDGTYDNITMTVDCRVPDTLGRIVSPQFGPAKQWKQLNWRGSAMEAIPGDNPRIDILGITSTGVVDTVMRNINLSQQTVDVSSISASQYPFLKLRMQNSDPVNNTPFQLKYWRLTYIPVPEGAIAPNIYFKMKDTLDVAETLDFKVAFKNISEVAFDSLKVRMVVTDRNNVQRVLPVLKHRPLSTAPNDTLNISYPIDTRQLVGANYLYVDVNPDNDQLEQYHFNNFAYHPFFVRGDTLNPLLDVTFDNIHILNHDIVSSKPDILIKLKDEAKFYKIDDPSKMKVKLKTLARDSTPASTKDYNFDGDTLQFVPAQGTENAATAIFRPKLADGKYELQVSGMDMSDNRAGSVEYRVIFEVINKAMISNMLNYPNPFTTSTAFVFTLTGSEVPQNIKIQILTITGKVVREVTKEELGPLHIGRNITEFKWDGTDQYGQKLANGVYLYRVVTNLNGKSLEKYSSRDDNTDKYFNKGYGKMYLMR